MPTQASHASALGVTVRAMFPLAAPPMSDLVMLGAIPASTVIVIITMVIMIMIILIITIIVYRCASQC